VIDTVANPPEVPAEPPSRVWRMVLIVVASQLVLIAIGMILFTAMGFASDGTGSCGGI
jgi:hypothetical protein